MKKIRSNFVKESLLDYENLAQTLKENTSSAVRDLLNETVRETYAQILNESEKDELEVEEVDDTESDNKKSKKGDKKSSKSSMEEEGDMEGDFNSEETAMNGASTEETPVEEIHAEEESTEMLDDGVEGVQGNPSNEEWAEFDKYKVGDEEYDFSNAEDDEIVKVYKLLKDDDQVLVNVDKEAQKVELKDNATGAEYLLDLGSLNGGSGIEDNDMETDFDTEDYDMEADGELDDYEDMNESRRIFEIALNEYDSHVGYTDNYQSKDVMTNPGMSEPGKNVNDWDAGVPKGSSKPWSGKKDSNNKPFTAQKGQTVEETEIESGEELEEATNVGGKVQQRSMSKSHIPNTKNSKARPYNQHHVSVAAHYQTEDEADNNPVSESRMMAKVNSIMKENNELKNALNKFKNVLEEAAVTNLNLGQIIKLISENSTTKAEKQEIIARFGKEAKTVNESKKLYESISRELKKNNTLNINEDKQFNVNGSKMINETQIYQSKDLLDSLDLMHKICK